MQNTNEFMNHSSHQGFDGAIGQGQPGAHIGNMQQANYVPEMYYSGNQNNHSSTFHTNGYNGSGNTNNGYNNINGLHSGYAQYHNNGYNINNKFNNGNNNVRYNNGYNNNGYQNAGSKYPSNNHHADNRRGKGSYDPNYSTKNRNNGGKGSGNNGHHRKGKGKGSNNYRGGGGGGGGNKSYLPANNDYSQPQQLRNDQGGSRYNHQDVDGQQNSQQIGSPYVNAEGNSNGGGGGGGGGGVNNRNNHYSLTNASTEDLVRRLKSSRSRPERQRALAELGGNPEHRKKLSAPAATVVVAAAGRDNGWRDALRWLELMKNDGSQLDVFHFSAGINACAKGRQWEEALQLLRDMTIHGVMPDEVCFNGCINACARAGKSEQALKLLEEMKSEGLIPNTVSYSAAISACAKGGEWERALTLMEEMRQAGLEPNVISYSAAISACAKGGQWKKSLSLLDEMRSMGLQVDVICYNAAIGACGGAKDYEGALKLMQEMRQENVTPNVVTFNAAINACEKAGQWGKVLWLLDDMKRNNVRPDIISYNLAIESCDKGHQGRRALGLLQEMRRTGVFPETITYNTVISALVKMNELKTTLGVWTEMINAKLEPSYSSTLKLLNLCVEHGAYHGAMAIFADLSDHGSRIQMDMTLHGVVVDTCNKAISLGVADQQIIEDFMSRFPVSKLVQVVQIEEGSVDASTRLFGTVSESLEGVTVAVPRSPQSGSTSPSTSNKAAAIMPTTTTATSFWLQEHSTSLPSPPSATLPSASDDQVGWQMNNAQGHIFSSPGRQHKSWADGEGKVNNAGHLSTVPLEEPAGEKQLGPYDWWASSYQSTEVLTHKSSIAVGEDGGVHMFMGNEHAQTPHMYNDGDSLQANNKANKVGEDCGDNSPPTHVSNFDIMGDFNDGMSPHSHSPSFVEGLGDLARSSFAFAQPDTVSSAKWEDSLSTSPEQKYNSSFSSKSDSDSRRVTPGLNNQDILLPFSKQDSHFMPGDSKGSPMHAASHKVNTTSHILLSKQPPSSVTATPEIGVEILPEVLGGFLAELGIDDVTK